MARLLRVYTLNGNHIGNHLITTSSMNLVRYVQVKILSRFLRPFVAQSKTKIDCSVSTMKLTCKQPFDYPGEIPRRDIRFIIATYVPSLSDVLTFHSRRSICFNIVRCCFDFDSSWVLVGLPHHINLQRWEENKNLFPFISVAITSGVRRLHRHVLHSQMR